MDWREFDADKKNSSYEAELDRLTDKFLKEHCVDKCNEEAVLDFASGEICGYATNGNRNRTVSINIFRPHEFDHITDCDQSLDVISQWLFRTTFDWKLGSSAVARSIRSHFNSGGNANIPGGREDVILDALVIVDGKVVAVEVEASNNLDNGYFSLRQAVKTKVADYGVMIVPWTANAPGRADEGKALGRLDREFEGQQGYVERPIFRIAIVREIDLLKRILNKE
jgi:hypothetical protein